MRCAISRRRLILRATTSSDSSSCSPSHTAPAEPLMRCACCAATVRAPRRGGRLGGRLVSWGRVGWHLHARSCPRLGWLPVQISHSVTPSLRGPAREQMQ